jgi:hypothetical protein
VILAIEQMLDIINPVSLHIIVSKNQEEEGTLLKNGNVSVDGKNYRYKCG